MAIEKPATNSRPRCWTESLETAKKKAFVQNRPYGECDKIEERPKDWVVCSGEKKTKATEPHMCRSCTTSSKRRRGFDHRANT